MAKKYIDAELIKSTRSLYFDIDTCITELIRARTEQNEENEGKALFRMEGLMVATMQQLNCIIDSLQQEQLCEDLEAEMEKYFDGWHDDPEYGQAVLPHTYECIGVSDCKDIARHFAEWQKEQFLKGDRLTELDKSYKQAKRELEWFKEGKRQGEQQMLKNAVKWLKEHINDYIVKGRDIDFMFDDFIKAMEDKK